MIGALGFLFDADRCTGCSACELACSTENALGWGRSWRNVVSFNPGRLPGVPAFHLSLACNHCEDAPCMRQCPTRAIGRHPHTGAVLIDERSCIGCRYCAWVCPYDAPRFDGDRGVMTKCTGCHHRLLEGSVPACVTACPTAALGFGPLEGETSVPGFPVTPARPAIRFRPVKRGAPSVVSSWEPPADLVSAFASARPTAPNTITWRAELPLLLFTTAVAALVGWVWAAALAGVALPLWAFAAGAGFAMAVSTLHLGQKGRAWRAVLNVRGSRLSREVVAFTAFAASGALVAALPAPPFWLAAGATVLGVITLVAVDRVYDPLRASRARPLHSADTLLTGPLVAALLAGSPAGYLIAAGAKLLLYARRRLARSGARVFLLAVLRVVFLAAPGLGAWMVPGGFGTGAGWLGVTILFVVLAGELVDRGEFYEELEVVSPRRQAAVDAARASP